MSPFWGELLGTFMLIVLGNAVVAGCLLEKSKAKGSGWLVITTGWAFAVIFGVFVAKTFGSSDAHINPAVTLGFAVLNDDYSKLLTYVPAQLLGAFFGACAVYLHFYPHWREANSQDTILAVFSTDPAIDTTGPNFFSEAFGTALLLIGIHVIFHPASGTIDPYAGTFFVGVLVWSIGLSMGGTTGYAINPARDLGPRIAHFMLPIPGKGSSNWGYAWLPVVAPFTGAAVAGLLLKAAG